MATGMAFVEVADRIWITTVPWLEVNITAVAGSEGVVLIDTSASESTATAVMTAVAEITPLPVVAAINTHVHFDHVLGNAVLARAGADLIAHENAAAAFTAHCAEVQADAAARPEPHWADVAAATPTPPTRTFSSVFALDLGDRLIEVFHPGPGHTDGDAVVSVADAGVVIAGDLVENSAGPHGGGPVPALGADSFPMQWPATLDVVLGLLTQDTTVVPGHGPVVDFDFVEEQRNTLAIVAETIRDLATRGVPLHEALDSASWPYPAGSLADAVARGYEHLPLTQRNLPLL